MTEYILPELDYDYSALEPWISGTIMELHYSKHHAAYVKGANDALAAMQEARADGSISTKALALSKNLSFHLGGHTNHSIFWKNLAPAHDSKPTGELASTINEFFGSFDAFVAHFSAAAMTLQGSGWAMLAWEPIARSLVIEQITDQSGQTSIGLVPLLLLDMWEHAFYLQYKNVKADYVKAFWNVVNWEDVQNRFAIATKTPKLV